MLRGFWNLFSCSILVSILLVLGNYESVVAQREGSSRQLSSGSGIREFLRKPGIATYEGPRLYPDGSTAKVTRTAYPPEWKREKGREYLVGTYKIETKTKLGLQLREVTVRYEVTSGHIAVVSIDVTRRGIPQVKSKIRFDPPRIVLQSPLREGEKWEQSIIVTSQKDDGPSQTRTVHTSFVVRGEETIHTPAGKFRTWRIEHTDGRTKVTYWWAKGRAVIKQQEEGQSNTWYELVEFKEPEN